MWARKQNDHFHVHKTTVLSLKPYTDLTKSKMDEYQNEIGKESMHDYIN